MCEPLQMAWEVTCGWLEFGRGIVRTTVTVEVLPSVAGPFQHPDVGGGETMQVVSMDRDEKSKTASIGLGGRGSWPPRVGITYPDI